MTTLRDPAMRRRFHRIDTPRFRAELCGRPAVTKDWSWGGVAFRIEGDEPLDLSPNQDVDGMLSLPSRTGPCPIRGRIVRVDERERTVAVELVDLTEELFGLFEAVLRAHLPPRERGEGDKVAERASGDAAAPGGPGTVGRRRLRRSA